MKSKLSLSIIIIIFLLTACSLNSSSTTKINKPSLLKNTQTITIASSYAFDISDTPRLVGWADNVFIGKVMKQNGTKSLDDFPETQFNVEVSDNIKGEFNGTVIVNQQGGGYKGNELILIENDQLLQEGQSYLFVTRHLKEENWNTLVPVYGDILITNEEAKKELIEKYTTAYKNEIPFNMSK